MSSYRDRERASNRYSLRLTVGDGFRIGIGIAFWHIDIVSILYGILLVGMFSLALLGVG